MKKILLSFLLVTAGISCWADEYYLVGDATPCGWATGDARKPMQMTETATTGVYEWSGLLKHGGDAAGNGFYICNSLSGWSALYPSETYPISDTGESTFQKNQEFKWNPTNTDWQFYTITLNTNEGKVSWVAGDAWITPDADGFYNIGTAKDLYWFSLVAIGNRSVKAKLTADIDYTAYPKGIIGLNSNKYAGTFDGQEHTVTIDIKNNTTCTGLFGVIDGATIKNLVVEGNCESSAKLIGGLGGVSYGNCTIENIVVKTAVKFTGTGDATCGGIFGDMEAASTVKNCAFYGSFESEKGSNIRALASWCSNNPQFTNCIIAPAEINANGYDTNNLANGGYTTNNCVKIAANDVKLASGELCYTMNGNQSEIGWYQNLTGTVDAKPVPFSSHSQVYANGALKCDGTSAGGELTYSNNKTGLIPPHTDENGDGICDVCGKLIPDFLKADEEGFYAISNATALNWFSLFVKEYNASANAKLTADIDYTAYPQGFIGNGTAYAGIFDGQNHTITIDLVNDAKIRGLFTMINGATIKNLVVDGSVTSEFNNLGGLGGQADGTNNIENVVINTTLTYIPGNGDASCGGFFPYINSGTVNFKNCAFYGSFILGAATGNAGLVSWNSGKCVAENTLIAPAVIEASAFNDFARPGLTTTNCYKIDATDTRLASGELCLMLKNGWYQTIGTDKYPVPFKTHGIVKQISEAGYATLYVADTDVEIPAGITANAGVLEGNWLVMKAIEGKIAAGDAVILKGDAGIYSFVPTTGATKAAANDLKGAAVDTEATGKYVLAQPENEAVGFYLANGGKIAAGKAYLELPAAGVKAFFFAEEETGIANVNVKENQTPVYNLAGQRINKLQKGINIVGGKKVLF